MKFLKNPIFVGVLVVVALGSIVHNFHLLDFLPKQKEVSKVEPAAIEEDTKEPRIEESITTLELERVGWGGPLPSRNPFGSKPDRAEAVITGAVDNLILSATWLQDTGRFAVINGSIVTEGEMVGRMRIEQIRADKVVVSGPRGISEILFRHLPPPPPPPAPLPKGAPTAPIDAIQEGLESLKPWMNLLQPGQTVDDVIQSAAQQAAAVQTRS